MNIEWTMDDTINAEATTGDEVRVVKANRDGTYQILVFTGEQYVIFRRAKITAFKGYDYDDGILCEATTQEIWESWGRDLPENTESEDE